MDPMSYDVVAVSAEFIQTRTKYRPEIGIICGSGLGGLADLVDKPDIFPYNQIPNFPVSTVPGHVGRLLLGNLEKVPVIIMQGRFHAYEGYELWKTAMPVRVMKLLGVQKIIVTNAGGGLNQGFQVGDIMFIKDHINLPGFSCQNPLRGPNDERFGPRFFPTNDLYCHEYRQLARQVGQELGLQGTVFVI